MYDEYRVDTQRWKRWPKVLIMTHEWSTNGHDLILEQRRYVPDNATQLEYENEKLRYLISDILMDEEFGNTEENTYYKHVRLANELGIEVE